MLVWALGKCLVGLSLNRGRVSVVYCVVVENEICLSVCALCGGMEIYFLPVGFSRHLSFDPGVVLSCHVHEIAPGVFGLDA